MYYNDYEDYMRNVLGYSDVNNSTYQRYSGDYNNLDYNDTNCGCTNYNYMNYGNPNYDNMMMYNSIQPNQFQSRNASISSEQIEKMYPEIYKIINPLVCKKCDNNTQPINEYLIEQMTDDIYDNVVNRMEVQNVININIGTREIDENVDTKESRGVGNNKTGLNNSVNPSSKTGSLSKEKSSGKEGVEEVRETRSPVQSNRPSRRNQLLRDLIRILILNRLIRRRPNRPPFRPGPGQRPPMPRVNTEYLPYM